MAIQLTRNRYTKLKVWGLRAIPGVIVVGAWLYASGPGGVSALILPALPDVMSEFFHLFRESALSRAVFVTLMEIVSAIAIAASVGIGAGFLLSRWFRPADVFEPILAWAYMFPLVLFYPLFLLWLGVGIPSKIFYAALGGVVPIAYNTLRGLRSVDTRFLTVGIAFGASKLQMDMHVKAGAARPMILSGLRIGVSVVLIYVILAELLGANSGLGYEINRATDTLDNARAIALIMLVAVITGMLQWMLERLTTLRGTRS